MSTGVSKKFLTLDLRAVGRRIRELRGFETKQAELAESLGIAQSYLSAIERGQKEPSATILFRIAKHYGKTIEWLLTGSDTG
ncbi:MAG TPA: helix-turn-helix transcriptional regulator [Terracidiphilus sp.]|nr:helix-turn-helix transcriptional regulator [Terracidiphilus sp.]